MTDRYTFEFVFTAAGEVKTTRRSVPAAEALAKFDQALVWKAKSFDRQVAVFGPGIQRMVVSSDTRARLESVLRGKRKLVGVAWLSATADPPAYYMHKLWRDGLGDMTTERVKAEDLPAAWEWLQFVCRWPTAGVWVNEQPGLAWGPQHADDCNPAAKTRPNLEPFATMFPGLVYNEAVRYTPTEPTERGPGWAHVDRAHPHIRSVRKRQALRRLRERYGVPDGETVDYIPEAVLCERYGYKKSYAEMAYGTGG